MKQTKGTTGRYPNNPYGGYKMAPSTNPPQAVASSLFLFHPPAYRSSQGYLGYFVTCTTLFHIPNIRFMCSNGFDFKNFEPWLARKK
jgi:hypothetical protein